MQHSTFGRVIKPLAVLMLLMVGLVTGSRVARADGPPEVKAKSVCIIDAETGQTIFAKNADDVRPIASTTKIFVAMAVRGKDIDLDGWTKITRDDVRHAKGGARTRLDPGQEFRNVDLMRAMLMGSDNRAPTALARGAGMSPDELIAEMNAIAKRNGLKHTKFTDVSGLRGNVSTAREMALALREALGDDVLHDIMSTPTYRIESKTKYSKIDYTNTNQSLVSNKHGVIGGKTGYTKKAGYCLITAAKIGDRVVIVAILGADQKSQRFSEFGKLASWLERGGEGAKVKVETARKGPTKPRLRVELKGKAAREE